MNRENKNNHQGQDLDKGEHKSNYSISSEEMFKDIYDELMETYQVVFEHIRKVDLLIKRDYNRTDTD